MRRVPVAEAATNFLMSMLIVLFRCAPMVHLTVVRGLWGRNDPLVTFATLLSPSSGAYDGGRASAVVRLFRGGNAAQ